MTTIRTIFPGHLPRRFFVVLLVTRLVVNVLVLLEICFQNI